MNNWKEVDLFNWLKENVYLDLVKSKNQMRDGIVIHQLRVIGLN